MMSLALHKKREEEEWKRESDLAIAEKRRTAREKHAANLESTLHKRPKRFEENDVSIRISKQQKETPVVFVHAHPFSILPPSWSDGGAAHHQTRQRLLDVHATCPLLSRDIRHAMLT